MSKKIVLLPGVVGTYEIAPLGSDESLLVQPGDFCWAAGIFGWDACTCGHTDGTISCLHKTVAQMQVEAREFLDEHMGAEVEDPGLFP